MNLLGDSVIRCVAALHAKGVVHGDVKLINIVLVNDKAHLIDFCTWSREGETRKLTYTLRYCPPEIYRKYHEGYTEIVAHKAQDIFCLGVVLLRLLLGKALFPLHMPDDEVRYL